MSKLAHSNDETMAEIERTADDLREPPWDCLHCGDRRYVLKPAATLSGDRETTPCPNCNAGGQYAHPTIHLSTPN